MATTDIKAAIINHSKTHGLSPDANGYVKTTKENLLSEFVNWAEIESQLLGGQGNELKPDSQGIVKFNAVHSSSALCVNNFAPFKLLKQKFSFLGCNGFDEASFEKQLPTGISTPNLDFYLEDGHTVIGIESKFTEVLESKYPNKNLDKYQNRPELDYLPAEFSEILQHYIDCKSQLDLDVAQLLKHCVGLIHRAQSRYESVLNKFFSKPKLVYLYWQPTNWYNFEVYRKHADEIRDFQERIERVIEFVPLSYLDFWREFEYDQTFGPHIAKVVTRYRISV